MLKGDSLRQSMPKFMEALQSKIKAHNQLAVGYFSSNLETEGADAWRNVNGRKVRLGDFDASIQAIENDVETIRDAFRSISRAIEHGEYEVKADCCPTVVSILSKYWFG